MRAQAAAGTLSLSVLGGLKLDRWDVAAILVEPESAAINGVSRVGMSAYRSITACVGPKRLPGAT